MAHKHHLLCIESAGRTESGADLYFCKTLGSFLEGPDPRAELRARLLRPREQVLREIASRHGLGYAEAASHVDNVRENIGHLLHGMRPERSRERLPAINEAWENLPGNFSYFDAAIAMRDALKGT